MLDTCLSCFIFTLFKCSCLASALDLGALSVFNSTEDLNITLPRTSTVDITNAPEGFVGCFHQAPPDGPQLLRTNFVDCFNAEKKIAAQDTPNPIRFRRNDLSAFTLPNSFTYRTCVIFLDMVSADAEDFFYVGQIRSAAIDTARRCTAFVRHFSALSHPVRNCVSSCETCYRSILPWTLYTTLISQDFYKRKC